MWLYQYYFNMATEVPLTGKVTTKRNRGKNRGKLATYWELSNQLLPTYATEKVISEAEDEITHSHQPDRR